MSEKLSEEQGSGTLSVLSSRSCMKADTACCPKISAFSMVTSGSGLMKVGLESESVVYKVGYVHPQCTRQPYNCAVGRKNIFTVNKMII